MPRSENQKMKLLYLQQYLLDSSDEDHPVTAAEIIDMLASHDIPVERKTVYADIATLQRYGLNVEKHNGGRSGYFVASRRFELPELKLLVDSVQSSQFITSRKTAALIKKIVSMASVYDAGKLQRQLYVYNRVKSMNESVYYTIDGISDAIAADCAIRFHYFDYTVGKERCFRKHGDWYTVSPFALMRGNEKYYMLAWDHGSEELRHYRVDKMTDITVTDQPRRGTETFRAINMPEYTRELFNMFSGEKQLVRMRFENSLVSAVIDRFGTDIMPVPDGPEHFTVTLEVVESSQFYAWLLGFGTAVEVLSPESVRENYLAELEKVAAVYRKVTDRPEESTPDQNGKQE